jgi:hypothetical protein
MNAAAPVLWRVKVIYDADQLAQIKCQNRRLDGHQELSKLRCRRLACVLLWLAKLLRLAINLYRFTRRDDQEGSN